MPRKRKLKDSKGKRILQGSLTIGGSALITAMLVIFGQTWGLGLSLITIISILWIIVNFLIGGFIGRYAKKITYPIVFVFPAVLNFLNNLFYSIQNNEFGIYTILITWILQPIIQGLMGMAILWLLRKITK